MGNRSVHNMNARTRICQWSTGGGLRRVQHSDILEAREVWLTILLVFFELEEGAAADDDFVCGILVAVSMR